MLAYTRSHRRLYTRKPPLRKLPRARREATSDASQHTAEANRLCTDMLSTRDERNNRRTTCKTTNPFARRHARQRTHASPCNGSEPYKQTSTRRVQAISIDQQLSVGIDRVCPVGSQRLRQTVQVITPTTTSRNAQRGVKRRPTAWPSPSTWQRQPLRATSSTRR